MNVTEIYNKRIEFEINKIIHIKDFFNQETTNKIENFFYNVMPDDWWSSTFRFEYDAEKIGTNVIPNGESFGEMNLSSNNEKINLYKKMALESFHNKKFSYFFNRTYENHWNTCVCLLCHLIPFMKSKQFITKISEITGYELTQITEIFASKYESGNFLSTHNDNVKGKLGLTIYFTKNWNPEYGGILHILSRDNKEIIRSYNPQFNYAVLFDIEDQKGVPHFISRIIPDIQEKRFAITCWLE